MRPVPAPSLWRVVVLALVVTLAANTLLWSLVRGDDTFARIIAVASAVAAAGLVVHRFVYPALMGEALLLSFAVWVANTLEYALEDVARWQSQVRQCAFYAALALLSLGAYIATRTTPTALDDQAPP